MPYIPHRPPAWRRDAPSSRQPQQEHDIPPLLDPNYRASGRGKRARGRASPTLSGGRASPAGRPDKRLRREDSWREHNFPPLHAGPSRPHYSERAMPPAPQSRNDWSWGDRPPSGPRAWKRSDVAAGSKTNDVWDWGENEDTRAASDWPASPMQSPYSTTMQSPHSATREVFMDTAASVVDHDELHPPRSVTSPRRSVTSPTPSSTRSHSTEHSRSTVRSNVPNTPNQTQKPAAGLVNGVAMLVGNDWGFEEGEGPARVGEWQEGYVPFQAARRSGGEDWIDPVAGGGWEAQQQEQDPLQDGAPEWEVTPVWEDGPVRDVEPESEEDDSHDPNDPDSGTPPSSTPLVNPSDLPYGVPKIVYNDVEKLEEICASEEKYIGLAAAFTDKARVDAVILATSEVIVLVNISDKLDAEERDAENPTPEDTITSQAEEQEASQPHADGQDTAEVQTDEQDTSESEASATEPDNKPRLRELLTIILGRLSPTNIAVELGRQALCIHRDLGIHVNGVDLSSTLSGTTRMFYAPEQLALLAVGHPHQKTLTELGRVLGDRAKREDGPGPMTAAVAAALFAQLFATGRDFDMEKIVQLDTRHLLDGVSLAFIAHRGGC
ncbi:hypothetical protein CALCODRAFT_191352 [Calocera cornea HHB12733]|uniref:Uncharacterized protein n=1 Tax=Calocera cornea HHB12733 TaxID=1353952 RepID=A0A165HM77_9BASI|nr:hypothetical protein CALCODRAFT_191352 [Calocera cornea HHB12733]